jgi:hypothetical protein
MGYVAALDPSRAGRRDPKPRDTLWRRSPPDRGGGIQSHGTRGGTGALPSREAGSEVARRVTVLEPSRTGQQGPVPLDTRQCVVTRLASCLSLELAYGVPGL